MFVSQTILILISGYFFLPTWNFTRFDFTENLGYRLLFNSALIGFVFWGLAEISVELLPQKLTEYAYQFDPDSPFLKPGLGVVYSIILSNLLNIFFDKSKWKFAAAKHGGNLLYIIIFEAISGDQIVEITMKSGEVYTGYPVEPVSLKNEYIGLVPYDSEVDILNYKIALNVKEVVNVRLFHSG